MNTILSYNNRLITNRNNIFAFNVSQASTLLNNLYGVWNADDTSTSLSTSLFGVWNANNADTTLDTSIYSVYNGENTTNDYLGNYNGTSVGSLTYSTGKINNAFSMNGSSYISLPTDTHKFTSNFSVSFWVYTTSLASVIYPISNYQTPGVQRGFRVGITSAGNITFNTYNGGVSTLSLSSANGSITTNTWYHIIVTFTPSGACAIYKNGVSVASGNSSGTISYTTSTYPTIGASKYTTTLVEGYLNGYMDATNFWSKTLSSDEALALYNIGNGCQYPFTNQVLPSPNDSYSTNNITLTNGAVYSSGKIQSSFILDGVNDYLSLSDGLFNFTSSFSISMWVNMTDISGVNHLASSLVTGANGYRGWHLYNNAGVIKFYTYNNNTSQGNSTGSISITANTWYHIVLVFNAGSEQKIYINSSQSSTNAGSQIPNYYTSNQYATIGAWKDTGPSISRVVPGKIDSFNIWSKVLTEYEVQQLYNAGSGVEYPYSGNLPTSKDNYSTNNGILTNGASFTTGKINSAFSFDGVNDYLALPNNTLNLLGDFSISFWYYTNAIGVEKYIISNYNSNTSGGHTNGTGFIVATQTNNSIGIAIYNTGYSTIYTASSTITANTWYHITITRKSGTRSRVYVNGTLSQSDTSTKDPIYPQATYSSAIGQSPGFGGYVNGRVDALSIWNKELTQTEVTELYNSGNGKQYPFT